MFIEPKRYWIKILRLQQKAAEDHYGTFFQLAVELSLFMSVAFMRLADGVVVYQMNPARGSYRFTHIVKRRCVLNKKPQTKTKGVT